MCTWANCRRGLCWHIHVDISETFWWAAALADQCWVVNTAPCISCSTQTGLHSLAVCCCLPRLSYVLLTACAVQSLQQSDRADRPNSCTHRHMQYPFKLPFFLKLLQEWPGSPKRNIEDNRGRILPIWMPNTLCQSTEWNSLWCQPCNITHWTSSCLDLPTATSCQCLRLIELRLYVPPDTNSWHLHFSSTRQHDVVNRAIIHHKSP